MKKSRAIVFDFPFSFRYIFASFCSRTILNMALESLCKDKSNDIKTFKNRTPTKRAARVRINQRYSENQCCRAGADSTQVGRSRSRLRDLFHPEPPLFCNTNEKKTVCNFNSDPAIDKTFIRMYDVVTYNIFLFSDDWRRSRGHRRHRGPWHSSVQSILTVLKSKSAMHSFKKYISRLCSV